MRRDTVGRAKTCRRRHVGSYKDLQGYARTCEDMQGQVKTVWNTQGPCRTR
jgi:hypothetical protein